jgi:hypothetical protein
MAKDSFMKFLLELVNLFGVALLDALDEEIMIDGFVFKVLVGSLELRKYQMLSLDHISKPLHFL